MEKKIIVILDDADYDERLITKKIANRYVKINAERLYTASMLSSPIGILELDNIVIEHYWYNCNEELEKELEDFFNELGLVEVEGITNEVRMFVYKSNIALQNVAWHTHMHCKYRGEYELPCENDIDDIF